MERCVNQTGNEKSVSSSGGDLGGTCNVANEVHDRTHADDEVHAVEEHDGVAVAD